jgi:hypothetical protein
MITYQLVIDYFSKPVDILPIWYISFQEPGCPLSAGFRVEGNVDDWNFLQVPMNLKTLNMFIIVWYLCGMCRERVPPDLARVVFGSFSLQWILSICLGKKRENHVYHRNQENQKIIERNPITCL